MAAFEERPPEVAMTDAEFRMLAELLRGVGAVAQLETAAALERVR